LSQIVVHQKKLASYRKERVQITNPRIETTHESELRMNEITDEGYTQDQKKTPQKSTPFVFPPNHPLPLPIKFPTVGHVKLNCDDWGYPEVEATNVKEQNC